MSQPVSRPEHPDHENPWAMQLVIHRNKQDPANHLDVLEAAGTAVVQLLDDPQASDPRGAWAAAVAHWRAGWIRKVARRAENKRWDDVHNLDGITAASGSAQVRALVPGPVDPLPAAIKKLQVRGTELPRLRASVQQHTVVSIEVTPHTELTTGKAAAQVGHAAQLAYEHLVEQSHAGDDQAQQVLAAWRDDNFRIRVEEPSVSQWDATDRPVRVMDAGLTEVCGVTETARAYW
ncbi:peptidyl-tRNA hydrolase [Enteractinococcus coprophilus]|uniref:Uncharacterized protein n=1 Tax=Enteractinococcus coprophilus TaxID=1027633 RepID=A0A543AMA9_9MICC|nr:peptidyl-tRNA hydrolase [Enteractinococcus coprophilus]TQL73689.1 hypothetical protein FB556_0131 [Enteractinococcus coprophilus]